MRIIINNIHSTVKYAEGTTEYAKFSKILREYLRVKVKGTHWIKKQGWDGYRYFITEKGTFATGYLPVVISLLEEKGANLELVDERVNRVEFNSPIDRKLPNGWLLEGYERGERGYQGESYRDWETDRKSTRLNSSHSARSRMPSSA